MKKCVLISLLVIIITLSIIFFIIWKNKTVYKITLDINPSIEIDLYRNKKIKEIKALNEDAKEIVKDIDKSSLDNCISSIALNVIEKGYTNDKNITILVHSEGIKNEEVKEKLIENFSKKDIGTEVIEIENITEEDKKIAKEYNITPSKAAYINSIKEDIEDVEIESIVNKPVNELRNTKETGFYCESDYTLENGRCFKKIGTEEPKTGEVCPNGYVIYNDLCYKEEEFKETDVEICYDDFILTDGKCVLKETRNAEGVCEKGVYDYNKDICVYEEYVADAIEFCRDPGRTLYEHKCLATKPSMNGKCISRDFLYNGKCLNPVNDYYLSEWKCPNGRVISNADGSLLYDDKKCYDEKKEEPKSYKCDTDYVLDGKICTRTEVRGVEKEKICLNNSTLIKDGRCIDLNDVKEKISGLTCDKNSRLENNICVVYDIKNPLN